MKSDVKVSSVFRDVKDSWLMDVRNLTDEQLLYDRNAWIKKYGRVSKDNEFYRSVDERETSIHTIAILIEQVRRTDEVYYNDDRQKTLYKTK